jgi:hypothetical protein
MNKRRQEFRELLGQLLFTFVFLMLQIVGVFIIFKDELF